MKDVMAKIKDEVRGRLSAIDELDVEDFDEDFNDAISELQRFDPHFLKGIEDNYTKRKEAIDKLVREIA